MYRRALAREQVAVNPTIGLEIPAARGRRDRIAAPCEGAALIEALPEADRAVWATAMYAGLRRGELRGLRWSDIDLDGGLIRVERGWDDSDGEIEAKTRAGRRSVPILSRLRRELVAHKLRTGRRRSRLRDHVERAVRTVDRPTPGARCLGVTGARRGGASR